MRAISYVTCLLNKVAEREYSLARVQVLAWVQASVQVQVSVSVPVQVSVLVGVEY